MNIKEILSSPRILQLSPMAFKAYFYLLDKSDNGVIKKFSIRGQAKEWDIDQNMNLTNNKVTMKKILTELENCDLVFHNIKKKELTLKATVVSKKVVNVKTDEQTGDGFIDIQEFKDIVDITKVHSYKIKELGNKALSIEFFDKNGNKLKMKTDIETSNPNKV